MIYLGNNMFDTDDGIVDADQFFEQFIEFLLYIKEKQDYQLLSLLDSKLKNLKLDLKFIPESLKSIIKEEVKKQAYDEGYEDGYSDGYHQALYEEELE